MTRLEFIATMRMKSVYTSHGNGKTENNYTHPHPHQPIRATQIAASLLDTVPPLSLSKKKKKPGMFVVPPLPHVKIITLLGKFFSVENRYKPIKMILKKVRRNVVFKEKKIM
jgi:hypothetical protein